MLNGKFSQKTAIVTGAARGIGNAIAVRLAEDGYAICIVDVFEEDKAAANIDKVKGKKQPVLYIKGDISSSESRKDIVKIVMNRFGRIDVLVNNAGVAPKIRMDMLETTEESMDYVLNINLKGTFFMTQQVANAMIDVIKGGNVEGYQPKIVNISSMSAYTSSVNRSEYCISKAGVSMVTTLFADRLAEFGINVYEVRPGIIMTDMTAVVKEKYDKLIEEGLLPLKHWGYPEDVANAVLVLCSGKLAYCTGNVINVDGGFHIRRL